MSAHAGGRGGRLAWHSLLNAAGQGIPVLVALAAVPVLVRGLGAERFGLLTLAWAIVGWFSFLDLGLGRALTQLVAERVARGEHDGLHAVVRHALRTMLVLGLAGGLLAALAASPFADWMKVSPALHREATIGFLLVAATIPAVVLTTGLRGVLEAHHRFDLVNAVRAPLGVLTYLGPVALLPWTRSLVAVTAVLLATRVAGMAAHWVLVRRVMPQTLDAGRWTLDGHAPLRQLIRSGGWMTVSGVLSPIMTTVDRFVVGALASAAVVAYYTAPYEMATKLLIVPGAIFSSVFPAFAAGAGMQGGGARAPLFARAIALVTASVLPAALAVALFAPELLTVWAGEEYALRGATVLRILAVGVACNALAHVPIALVQAAGRSDLAARLHLLEIVPYLAALWLLVGVRGVEGAALAWALRAAVDALVLFELARRVAPELRASVGGGLWALAVVTPLLVALTSFAAGLPIVVRAALLLAASGATLALVWRRVVPSRAEAA